MSLPNKDLIIERASKLSNTLKKFKYYWSSLKTFLNNKKIPLILPLFHGSCFIGDFKEKAELLDSFFSNLGSLIANHSKLRTTLKYVTNKRLLIVTFSPEDIGKIIRSLDPNKARSHDNKSICIFNL